MTKWIFAILIFSCFLFSSGVQAQGHYRNNAIGVYIGPNFSNIDITSPQLNADSTSGYQAAIYYRSGKFVYGQAGLQFQKMNSNFQMTDSTPDVSDDVTFKRIQMPAPPDDVFIGTSVRYAYGVAKIVSRPTCDSIAWDVRLAMTPVQVLSSYNYTESFIRGTVMPQLQQLIGTLDPTTEPYKNAVDQLSVWQQLLDMNDDVKTGAGLEVNRASTAAGTDRATPSRRAHRRRAPSSTAHRWTRA